VKLRASSERAGSGFLFLRGATPPLESTWTLEGRGARASERGGRGRSGEAAILSCGVIAYKQLTLGATQPGVAGVV